MAGEHRTLRAFTLSEEEEELAEHAALTSPQNGSSSHRQQAVFNIDLDSFDDDDALLNWEQYEGMNRVRCCGIDCTLLARRFRPPQWWHSYTKRQRRCILGVGVGVALLLALLVALIAMAAIRGGSRSMGDVRTGELPGTPTSPEPGQQAGPGAGGQGQDAAGGQAVGAPPSSPGAAGEGGPASRKPAPGGQATPMEGGGGQLCSWAQYRLPTTVVPLVYNLTLNVSMADPYPVAGEVAIAVNVTQDTNCVVLHGAEMDVLEARLGGSQGSVGKVTPQPERQQLILEFSELLPRQGAQLWLAFRYNLRAGMAGFYRSTYTLADGKQRSLATTQFEAASARLAFPCFDEPAFKAVFDVEVIAPAGLTVLSNTLPRGVHEHPANKQAGTRTWHFKPTPPMSTYLVCFVAGEFTSTSRLVKAGSGSVNVSVWGTPDRVANLQYAADTAAAILPAYEAALGVPYPLEKLDLVAIPDFSAGAMENWGLITYRETALLASPTSSLLDLRYIAVVVAHEIAHQWFGNLVTMHWWSELWLNEGFASYWEYVGATAAHADNEYFATFYSDNVPYAQYFDSKRASHALSQDPAALSGTDAIESVFDAVSYQKGAAVLRMLRAWANRNNKQMPLPTFETTPGATPKQDAFLRALGQYLKQHQYGTAQAADLWTTLSGPLGFDVPKAMMSWTYQQGYPVVTAEVDSQRRVWLLQAPFTLTGIGQCDPSTAWWIPVSFVTSDDPGRLQWGELNGCSSDKPLVTLRGDSSWVKVNAGQYGYYRVRYSLSNGTWAALAGAASSPAPAGTGADMALSGADVAGLIEDAFSLAEAGEEPIAHFLDLLLALRSRPAADYEPWAAALPYVYKLERLLRCSTEWKAWVGDSLIRPYLKQQQGNTAGGNNRTSGNPAPAALLFSFFPDGASVPAANQTIGYRLLRPAILKAGGLFTLDLQVQAINLLQSLEPPEGEAGNAPLPANTIEPDIRSAVYASAARNGYWEIYNTLTEMYKAATDVDEKMRCLMALAYAPGGSNIGATLQLALSADVRAQDVRSLVVATAANAGRDALNLTWDWLGANFDAVLTKLGGDFEAAKGLASIVERVGSLFGEPQQQAAVDGMMARFKGRQVDPGHAARAKESIAANARWLEQHGQQACAWIKTQAAAAPLTVDQGRTG